MTTHDMYIDDMWSFSPWPSRTQARRLCLRTNVSMTHEYKSSYCPSCQLSCHWTCHRCHTCHTCHACHTCHRDMLWRSSLHIPPSRNIVILDMWYIPDLIKQLTICKSSFKRPLESNLIEVVCIGCVSPRLHSQWKWNLDLPFPILRMSTITTLRV